MKCTASVNDHGETHTKRYLNDRLKPWYVIWLISTLSTLNAGLPSPYLKGYLVTKTDVFDSFSVDKGEEIIILKDSKEDHWDKGKRLPYSDTPQTIAFRQELDHINHWLEQADIQYVLAGNAKHNVDDTDRRLYRYFNNRSFEQGGRLFGGFWQPLKKHQREDIFIDGLSTITLDYSQMLPRILYGSAGEDIPFEDAYTIPGLESHRDGVKKVFNAMLHTEKPLNRKPKGTKDLLPKGRSIKEIRDMITVFHQPVAHAFDTRIGLSLTNQESRILITVLTRLIEQGITALPVHDAVIVAEDYEEQTRKVMLDVFREVTGIEGIVRLDQ
jgi:hypothetical protein